MKKYNSSPLDFTARNLQEAFIKYYDNFNPKDPSLGKPQFKKKYKLNSFKLKKVQLKNLELNSFEISKLKNKIKFINHRNFDISNTNSISIIKSKSDKYFAVFYLEQDLFPKLDCEPNNKTIAIDLGVRKYFTWIDSEGNQGIIENPKAYKDEMKRIIFLDKVLKRKKNAHNKRYNLNHNDGHIEEIHKYSNRYQRVRIQRAKHYEHLANIRTNFLNNLTTKLVKEYNKIIIEDCRVTELIDKTTKEFKNKSRQARKNIHKAQYDVGWYNFRLMLEYKCKLNNRELIIADEFYRSTQECSNCGYINKELEDVNIREWTCPECNTYHDRDINACENLMKRYN
jgi:putative transposase